MDFDLTEEQRMLQASLGQLLANECPVTHLREIFDGETGHDPALWKSLVEMGTTAATASSIWCLSNVATRARPRPSSSPAVSPSVAGSVPLKGMCLANSARSKCSSASSQA